MVKQVHKKRLDPKTIPEISRRMRLLRRTTGLNQTEFAREVDIARNVWASVEGEHGRIGLDAALKLGERFAVTLDWVYKGDEFALPLGLVQRLREVAAEEDGSSGNKAAG